jgi:superkiller protein 3
LLNECNFKEIEKRGNGMEITGWDTGFEQASGQGSFEKGEAALCACKYPEAANYFGQALKADPFNVKAHRGLSDACWAQGQVEDALNSLTRALELEPGDRDTVLACTRIFNKFGKDDFSRQVLQSYLDKNPQDAEVRSRIESLDELADQGHFNNAAEFFLRQGESQFERGNMVHAVACFEMAIEQNPQMAEAYNDMGVINLEGGKIPEALENFLKALNLKPGDPEILVNSVRALTLAGQIDAAIEVQREYLRRCPEDNRAWPEYESMIRRSARSGWRPDGLSKEVADIYIQMAEMLEKAGDVPGAAEAVEKALKIEPAAPESLYQLASLHCAIGQKDEAAGILDQALVIDPSHVRCSDMLKSIRNGNGAQVS